MKTEYEVRILEVEEHEVQEKLLAIGAKKVYEGIQKRLVFDFNPVNENKWIRLRQSGDIITLTIKEVVDKNDVAGTKEMEVQVSDFDEMHQILVQLGYEHKAYQENHRIKYLYKNSEICIDSWPLIPTYIEIEGASEKDVFELVEILGLKDKKVTTIDVLSVYNEIYGIDIMAIKDLKF